MTTYQLFTDYQENFKTGILNPDEEVESITTNVFVEKHV
jgi:hypothetical protein